jgi:succinate dehydrogenase/fumarate reductase flavoprotein subunit
VNTTGRGLIWDKEVDVIVVGFGAAGGVSAITAHDAGAKVLLIEKMPHPGGISILSGGGVAFARNAEGAFQYLKRTCNGTTPDNILRAMADPNRNARARHLSFSRHQGHRFHQAQRLSRLFGFSLGQGTSGRRTAFQGRLRQCPRPQD